MYKQTSYRRRFPKLAICLCVAAIALETHAQQPGDAAAAKLRSLVQLKQAARDSFLQADPTQAREHLVSLFDEYREEYAGNPSWQGTYQWSRRLAEVAHEHLRAGQFDDVLAILGEAADLDVPRRNGFDNGLASVAGGLHRHLAALDGSERFDVLSKWSMPTGSRQTVRVLESFVPMTAPPSAFARVFGERPRDTSFPIARVGEVSGLFSTAWELVKAADDAGRLRQLTGELEKLEQSNIPNADHVLTLARIVGSDQRSELLVSALVERLSQLRDGRSATTGGTGFDDAWQYGYGTFDATSGFIGDFNPLLVWSGAAWQMSRDRPHESLGFLRVDRDGGHPENGHACVRRWTAPADGVVSVSGTLHHPTEAGDGVIA
ncbi:MAG: hypothetical protein ABI614_18710, partial [Planctomycetota bacterium]